MHDRVAEISGRQSKSSISRGNWEERRSTMDQSALMQVIPEVIVLGIFPFLFYGAESGRSVNARSVWALLILLGGAVVGWQTLLLSMRGWSPTGLGSDLAHRLAQSPWTIAFTLAVVPFAAAKLAAMEKGTLGMWVFALWAGYISYFLGRGWYRAEMDWVFTLTLIAVAGALCGAVGALVAGLPVWRVGQLEQRGRKVLLWAGLGAIVSALGTLAGWLLMSILGQLPRFMGDLVSPVEAASVLYTLAVVAAVWLSLSVLAAVGTGYIRPKGRDEMISAPRPQRSSTMLAQLRYPGMMRSTHMGTNTQNIGRPMMLRVIVALLALLGICAVGVGLYGILLGFGFGRNSLGTVVVLVALVAFVPGVIELAVARGLWNLKL
jgi:hypothetical protein